MACKAKLVFGLSVWMARAIMGADFYVEDFSANGDELRLTRASLWPSLVSCWDELSVAASFAAAVLGGD